MIRAATKDDIEEIEGLIRRQYQTSSYVGTGCEISDKVMRETLSALIAMQKHPSVGGTHVIVAVRDKKVVGFLAAVLQRVYFIGNKLEAGDVFFVNEGQIGDTMAMVESYLAWGRGNRKVLDMKLSWTDAIPGAEKVTKLFQRKGFTKTGEVWKVRK